MVVFCLNLFAGQVFGDVVSLDSQTDYIHLVPHLSYIEDKENRLNFEDVSGVLSQGAWVKAGSNALNFGYTDSVFWLKSDFQNSEAVPLHFLIEIAYPVLDDIQVFIQRGSQVKTLLMGDKRPFYDRPYDHRNFIFPLRLSPHEALQVYFRFKSTSSMQIPVSLYDEGTLLEKTQTEMVFLGLYYGSMMIMILYNLFVFFSVREVKYLFYVLYVTCMACFLMSLNGISYQFLWPESLWWNDQVIVVSLSGVVFFAILFTADFLNIKSSWPKCYRVFMSFGVLALSLILFSPVIPYKTGIISTIILAMISIHFGILLTLLRWWEGYKSARFYALAWFVMFLGGVILALSKFNLLPRNPFTEYATQYGSILEVMLLSYALADRLNIVKRERIRAQKIAHEQERNARIANERALLNERKAGEMRERAFEIQKKTTETLEANVRERTAELNDILEKASDVTHQIMSSLNYARMIQLSMLPDSEKVLNHFPQHFIWWMPRDVVGGDFYFMEKIGTKSIVAVADCTGHGVPGAFMTIISNSELKRIIRGEGCFHPGDILTRLNRRIRQDLKQDTPQPLSDDGLDIGICVYDSQTRTLSYAGARMNLVYTRGNTVHTLSGDKTSVGYVSSDLDHVFEVYKVDVCDDMMFYLFTDGITDQPGETKRIRFGTKTLKSLIASHSHLSLKDQHALFMEALVEHRGQREQVDDMTMVAFSPV